MDFLVNSKIRNIYIRKTDVMLQHSLKFQKNFNINDLSSAEFTLS